MLSWQIYDYLTNLDKRELPNMQRKRKQRSICVKLLRKAKIAFFKIILCQTCTGLAILENSETMSN